jgi:hypothetical protein
MHIQDDASVPRTGKVLSRLDIFFESFLYAPQLPICHYHITVISLYNRNRESALNRGSTIMGHISLFFFSKLNNMVFD